MSIEKPLIKWVHSLHGKIFFICFSIAISVMALSIWPLYNRSAETIEENAYNYIHESMIYADNNLNIMIKDALNISLVMATSENIIKACIEEIPNEASYQWYKRREEINDFLFSLMAYKNHILLSAVIGRDGRCFQTGGELILKRITSEEWFEKAIESTSVHIFYNTPTRERIFLCRPIKYNKETVAVAVIELDYGILSKVYNVAPLEQAQIITMDANGNIAFSNADLQAANIYETPLASSIKNYNAQKKYYKIDGQNKLMVLYHSMVSQLTTVGLISYDDLITDALKIRENMLMIASVSVLIAMACSWAFSRVICRNIDKFQHSMKEVKKGNLKIRADESSKDEIGDISRGFNSMMDQIENLLNEVREKEKQKREAEQKALQAQIQPHFIYNALNSVKYVAHMRKESEIEEVSTALIELMRSVLGNNAEFIPIYQEFQVIDHYMKIQRFKYHKPFQMNWDVEDDLWDFRIPKLLLQPIVENALFHGILQRDDGYINIKIYKMQNQVIFNVTDNGAGMTEDEISRLLTEDRKDNGQFRGIGLKNVIERIQLIYGSEYGGKITSFKGMFTSVELTLPYMKEGA